MASLHGRLEARIVIPTGNWTFDAKDSGGTESNMTLTAAKTYYHGSAGNDSVSFAAKVQALLNASATLNGTYTVSVDTGELGTGKYTISCTENFALVFDDTAMRDLMGYQDNIGNWATPNSSTETSGYHAQGLWLPDCPVNSPTFLSTAASNTGLLHSAAVVTLSEDGTYYSWHGASHRRTELTWEMVTKAKTWLAGGAAGNNETYEEFWIDAIRAEKAWAQAGRQIKFYPDTTVATAKTFNVLNVTSPEITIVDASYDGWWRIRLEVAESV